jgi:hypothetical protein
MQLINSMMANMHKMHSADVALTYARDYAAPTGGCLTIVLLVQVHAWTSIPAAAFAEIRTSAHGGKYSGSQDLKLPVISILFFVRYHKH